jgi:hypothetical protein
MLVLQQRFSDVLKVDTYPLLPYPAFVPLHFSPFFTQKSPWSLSSIKAVHACKPSPQ